MPILVDNGRGVHPKLRPSCFRFWPFDETSTGPAYDLVAGDVLDSVTLNNPSDPLIVRSPIGGRARRFNNVGGAGYPFDNWLYGAGDATSRTNHVGNFTLQMWIRLTSTPASRQYVYAYAGPADDGSGNYNYLRSLRVETSRRLSPFWEYSTGTNVDPGSFSPVLELHRWYHVAVRWSGATGEGPGGVVDVDLFLNGVLVDGANLTPTGNPTFQGLTNASGGSTAAYVVGAEYTLSNNPTNFFDGDIAGVYLYSEALSSEEIEDDFRRGMLMPFFHRVDARLLTEAPDGVLVDMSDHLDSDFLIDATVDDSVDNAAATLSVTLAREVENLSLATLRSDSVANVTDPNNPDSTFDPLLDVPRSCALQVARIPLGVRANDSDFADVFVGKWDEVDWGSSSSVVTARARDLGGVLVDTIIEEEVKNSAIGGETEEGWNSYGDEAGTAVEGEMQLILNDNDNTPTGNSVAGLTNRAGSYPATTLYTPTSPGWLVLPWRQRREPVMTALRALAGQIGWDCRYRYDPRYEDPQWRLTFYEPNRLETVPVNLLRQGEVLSSSRASIDIQNIRNFVRVCYQTSEPPDTAPTTAAASIDASFDDNYKNKGVDGLGNRRPAFYEAWDTASIAKYGRRMMEMQESTASQVDTIDEAQRFAIAALRDLREPDFDHSITTVPLPEIVVGDVVRMDSNDELYTGPQQMAVVSTTLRLAERAETTMNLRGKPSVGFRRWLAAEARPGVGRPPVIDPLEALTDVNVGGLLQVTSGLVNRTDYFSGGKFLAVRNPDFRVWSRGIGNPPDAWTLNTGTWGTSVDISTDSLSGTYSLQMDDSETPVVLSDPFPVDGDTDIPYSFEAVTKRGAAAGDYLQMQVYWYDATRSLVGSQDLTSLLYAGVPADTSWHKLKADGIYVSSSSVRFGRIALKTVAGNGTPFLVDSVSAYRTSFDSRYIKGTDFAPPAADGWYNIRFNAPPLLGSYDHGKRYVSDVGNGPPNNGVHYLCKHSGRYRVTVSCMPYSNTVDLSSAVRVAVNANYTLTGLVNTAAVDSGGGTVPLLPKAAIGYGGITPSYAAIAVLTADVELVEGDRLSAEVYLTTAIGYLGNAHVAGIGQVTYMRVTEVLLD